MNDQDRPFHVSPVQVVAGALASITAAVLASFFGVTGTVIGAGLASAAASIGNAVYGYWIRSTHQRLRDTMPSALKQPTVSSPLREPVLSGVGARGSGSSHPDRPDEHTEQLPA